MNELGASIPGESSCNKYIIQYEEGMRNKVFAEFNL